MKTLAEIADWCNGEQLPVGTRDGFPFVPIGLLVQEFNKELGPAGWKSEVVDGPRVLRRHQTAKGGQVDLVAVVVRLTFIGTDGSISRQSPGAAYSYPNDPGRFAPAIAESYAIRRAAALMGPRFGMKHLSGWEESWEDAIAPNIVEDAAQGDSAQRKAPLEGGISLDRIRKLEARMEQAKVKPEQVRAFVQGSFPKTSPVTGEAWPLAINELFAALNDGLAQALWNWLGTQAKRNRQVP